MTAVVSERQVEGRNDYFSFDHKDPLGVMLFRADWLADEGLVPEEEELIRLQLEQYGPHHKEEVRQRIQDLQVLLGIKATKIITINKLVSFSRNPGRQDREVRRTKQMILTEPLGTFYTKATIQAIDIDDFDLQIRSLPIVKLTVSCPREKNLAKYFKYVWLEKIKVLELNSLGCSMSELPNLFKGSIIKPDHLIISGTAGQAPSESQALLLPIMAPCMKQLKSMTWGRRTFDYTKKKYTN